MRILLVEDDVNLGRATKDGLKEAYAADWVNSAEEAKDALATIQYDLVVLDVNLPGISGLQLLKDLRDNNNQISVLLLTARDALKQKVEGLNAGADDYLVKPFELDELLARCSAILRRKSGKGSPVIIHKNISYEPATGYVAKNGEPVSISGREKAILDCLISNIGRVISKEKIMEKIYDWSSEDIESNTIEVHVSSLRKKLGSDFIKTIRGLGYVV